MTAADERPFWVLRERDFRLLWSAELLSDIGSQVQRVAVAWQVFELTHDPLQLGLLGLARFVPLMIFGLAGGVVADRYDRRGTLMLSELALLATSATLTAMTVTGNVSLPWIYVLTAVAALFGSISGPTRQALIPTLVPKPSLPAAMTMGVLSFQTAGMIGPALGGALVATVGLTGSYAVDAITFGLVALAAYALRTRPGRTTVIVSGREAILEGLRFLRQMPTLLGTMSLDFVANFFGASTTLMPIFAADILGGGPQTLGWLLAAPAIGAVSGASILASRRPLTRPGLGILVAVIIYGACIATFAVSRNLWFSLLLLAGSGIADSVSVAQRHTLRNLLTPDHLRGRVAAAHSTFAGGGPQLGEFEAGVVARGTSAPVAVAIGGLGTIAAALIIWKRVPGIAAFGWASFGPAETESAAPQTQRKLETY